MKEQFTITKANGTVLTKEVDSTDEMYIARLARIGWKKKSYKPSKKTKKSKKNKK